MASSTARARSAFSLKSGRQHRFAVPKKTSARELKNVRPETKFTFVLNVDAAELDARWNRQTLKRNSLSLLSALR